MKKLTVVLLTVLFGGCYTELQLANKETTTGPTFILPPPIIIIELYYPPFPPPQPCPPPPRPPQHPVIIPPAEQADASPAKSDRIRTDGSTRDDRTQTDRGGRRR